jgi:hypothetical protein
VTELDPAEVPDALRSGALDVAVVHEYDYVPAEPETRHALVPELALADRPPGVTLTALGARRPTLIAYRRGSAAHPAVAACTAALRAATADYTGLLRLGRGTSGRAG